VDDSQVTGPFVSEQARANYHFTTAQRRSDLWSIAATSGSLEALGTYFHAEQDSFSHADYGPTYGHLFAGHGPDKTYNDPEKADTMANDTYNRLIQSFAFSCYVTNDSIGWALIRPFVQRFNRARTDQAKDVALNDLRTFIHNEQEKRKRISSAADEDGAARSCRLGNPAACDAHDQGQAQGETH
jgi:hypothetical protein